MSDIVSIGITNQRETTVIWDKDTGKPLYNAIVWQDKRTSSICDQMKRDDLSSYVKENTGLVIDSYFSATKVKWIIDNVEGVKSKLKDDKVLFGTIDSWLIYNMTNFKNHVTDYTNASRTMMYDIRSLQWDKNFRIFRYSHIYITKL